MKMRGGWTWLRSARIPVGNYGILNVQSAGFTTRNVVSSLGLGRYQYRLVGKLY
jgi:hypothetical protein